MTSPITTIHTQTAFTCSWYTVRQSDIVLPDGTAGQYNVVDVPACAFVVPITADNQIILIHQYRYPLDKWVWEIPAGAVHPGQTLLESAQTELLEEVGGTSDSWTFLGEFQTANGRSNEIAHLYLAQNVAINHATAHESAEILTVHTMPIPAALNMIHTNQLQDAPSALAILLAYTHLQNTP